MSHPLKYTHTHTCCCKASVGLKIRSKGHAREDSRLLHRMESRAFAEPAASTAGLATPATCSCHPQNQDTCGESVGNAKVHPWILGSWDRQENTGMGRRTLGWAGEHWDRQEKLCTCAEVRAGL